MAGLPDITAKLKCYDTRYEEVIFRETIPSAVDRVLAEIRKAEAAVWRMGAIPVFCTVAPMSLLKWNSKRLRNRVTTQLKYPRYYTPMQRALEEATFMINEGIHAINRSNNVRSPRVGESILSTKNRRRQRPVFRRSKLEDGVHPTPFALLEWADAIATAYVDNHLTWR